MNVLRGRAAEHEGDVPFGLVVDAFDGPASRLRAARIEEVAEDLAVVLPSMRGGGGTDDRATDDAASRFRLNRALRALLEELSRERPAALVLDDLHWADQASLDFVLHLLRHPPERPYLLVFALRPSAAELRLLDAARGTPGWTELRVGPLGDEDATSLLPSDLDTRESGGGCSPTPAATPSSSASWRWSSPGRPAPSPAPSSPRSAASSPGCRPRRGR